MIGLLLQVESFHSLNVWSRYSSFLALVRDGTIALMLEISDILRSYRMLADIESRYLIGKTDSKVTRWQYSSD